MDISKYVKLTICFKKIIILSSCFRSTYQHIEYIFSQFIIVMNCKTFNIYMQTLGATPVSIATPVSKAIPVSMTTAVSTLDHRSKCLVTASHIRTGFP